MSARDELAGLIGDYHVWSGDEGCSGKEAAADAILAAGYSKPRAISTIEELDALPLNSVVRSNEFLLEKLTTGWFMPSLEVPFVTNPNWLPATVLYTPKES